MSNTDQGPLSASEKDDVEERSSVRAPVVHEIVRKEGEDELQRPSASLFWSGLAAGVTIMTSVIAEGAIRNKLPADVPWRELVSDIGYSLGFLMVILGRMQLFTEQTIVSVLPLAADPTWRKLGKIARLWSIVFVANMLGACAAAALNVFCGLMGRELLASMVEVSSTLLHKTPSEILLQGIPAGFLIASVAWIRAAANGDDFWIILVLTYAIALGDFTHVIAGAAETFLLLFSGKLELGRAFAGIIVPSLIGNILGGTGLFALLAHAQVRQEL
ncbi:formate/nitrite transporter family protein [Methylorubrum extorquens]